MKNLKVVKKIFAFILLLILWVLLLLASLSLSFAFCHWLMFSQISSDSMIFYLQQDLEGTDLGSYTYTIIGFLVITVLVLAILGIPLLRGRRVRNLRSRWAERIKKRNQRDTLLSRFIRRQPSLVGLSLYSLLALIISLSLLGAETGLGSYMKSAFISGNLYEENYVDPRKVDLKFPAKKRNILLIYIESMENTLVSKKNGGAVDRSRIPELESIALDPKNVNFSDVAGKIGGAQQTYGLGWSLAGITAVNGGVPLVSPELKVFTRQNGHNIKSFMPGAYMMGNILRDHGYNERFLLAADVRFGGLDTMLKEHGNPDVYDYLKLRKMGKLPPDYKVFWGFEDKKLFGFAKEQIEELDKQGKPFYLSLFTADTHIPNGYLDETCAKPFNDRYDNVHACNSKMVAEFLQWFEKQPVAKDTTVILTGDHLGMKTAYYEELIGSQNYNRTVYNAFINPAIRPVKKRPRQFTNMDLFPTILASIGVKIPGERLGLGTNLFADKETMLEKFGSVKAYDSKLEDRSEYYQHKLLMK